MNVGVNTEPLYPGLASLLALRQQADLILRPGGQRKRRMAEPAAAGVAAEAPVAPAVIQVDSGSNARGVPEETQLPLGASAISPRGVEGLPSAAVPASPETPQAPAQAHLPDASSQMLALAPIGAASVAGASVSAARSGSAGGTTWSATLEVASNQLGNTFTFLCPKCQRQCPVSQARARGAQTWCAADNNSYAALQQRWARNRKLKDWWNGLNAADQTKWFQKWQQFDTRKRFDTLKFIERTVESFEMIEDDVDAWMTYDKFYLEKKLLGLADPAIEGQWRDIVNGRRAECIYRRNQWLIPRYEGFERRVRRRLSQELESQRSISVEDAEQLTNLLLRGRETLMQARGSVQPTLTIEGRAGPSVISTPGDQPAGPQPANMMLDNVEREVRAVASDEAQRRQMEADELTAANLVGDQPQPDGKGKGKGKGKATTASQLALDKTKVENAARTLKVNIEGLYSKVIDDFTDLTQRVIQAKGLTALDAAADDVVVAMEALKTAALASYDQKTADVKQIEQEKLTSSSTKFDYDTALGQMRVVTTSLKQVAVRLTISFSPCLEKYSCSEISGSAWGALQARGIEGTVGGLAMARTGGPNVYCPSRPCLGLLGGR